MSTRISFPSTGSLVMEGGTERFVAAIPGTVHEALIAAGKISDPFYRTQELDCQWVDKENWLLTIELNLSADQLKSPHADLVFEGIDTYADLRLNGAELGKADNMHRTWRFPAKALLKAGKNTLEIRFRSPMKEDAPKFDALPYALPATNDQSERGGMGDKRVSVFARKAPYHYGWDWGPRLVTSGLWRPAYIETWEGARIVSTHVRTPRVDLKSTEAIVLTEIFVAEAGEYTISHRLTDNARTAEPKTSKNKTVAEGVHTLNLRSGTQVLEHRYQIADPKLWWCNGHGEAHLYRIDTAVSTVESGKAWKPGSEKTIDSQSRRFGVRTIEVRRENDEFGKSFYFALNGRAVFAKGANYIPNDNFLPRVSNEVYRHILGSAKDANMNMIRVWGGGVYEDDRFYELCDELGLMVWQDFLFGCSMYPADEVFMASVRAEIEDNIRRIRSHACLALWCGNNEIDTAWSEQWPEGGWGWKQLFTPEARKKMWQDYERIFHQTLPEAVSRLDPDHFYWPSSPLADFGEHAKNTSDSGDVHYWGVWHAKEPFENYRVIMPRFMSEYGFQSFPEPSSIRRFAELPADTGIESEVMKSHQRSPPGNGLIAVYMEKYLAVPKDFDDFLVASQVLQAEGMKTAIEAHRTRKPRCMGSLYWQLNDCWPAASWSGMDFYGRWKALHYYARRAFAPLLLSLEFLDNIRVVIYGSSDLHDTVDGKLNLRLSSLDGTWERRLSFPATLAANSAAILLDSDVAVLAPGRNNADIAVEIELADAAGTRAAIVANLLPARDLNLPKTALSVKTVGGTGSENDPLLVEVTSATFARGVCVELPAGHELAGQIRYSDNYFDMMPGARKTIAVWIGPSGPQTFKPGQKIPAPTSGKVTTTEGAQAPAVDTKVSTELSGLLSVRSLKEICGL